MARHDSSVPGPISQKLSSLESHVRRLKLLRGVSVFSMIVAAAFAAGFLVDILRENSLAARLTILGAVLATCAVAFYFCLVRPFFRRYTAEELAAVVERSHPELQESLSSTIELRDPQKDEQGKGSPLMRAMLEQATVNSTKQLNFNRTVSPRRSLRSFALGTAALLVLLAPFVLTPNGYGLLWARFFAPWKNFDSAGNLYFDIDHGREVVARGTNVEIVAEPQFRYRNTALPKTAWLYWENEEGTTDSIPMKFDSEQQKFTATVPHVFDSFKFKVRSEGAVTREYAVKVVDAPTIDGIRLDVEPPAYTGLPARHFDGAVGEIPVFERSTIKLAVKFNKPVEKAEIEWLSVDAPPTTEKPAADGANPVAAPAAPAHPDFQFQLSPDKKSATLTGKATLGGQFAVRLTDEYGLTNKDIVERRLLVIRDQAPVLQLEGGQQTQRVRPSDVVGIHVRAADDIGLGALELHYEVRGGAKDILRVDPQRLGGKMIAHSFRLDLSAMKAAIGDTISYRIRAADERPVPGPNETWSNPSQLIIDEKAKPAGTKNLAERQKQIQETIAAIRKDVEKNRAAVDDVRKEAEEDRRKQLEFNKDDAVADLAKKQGELGNRLEQLADKFAGNPLFANLTKKVQEVARDDLQKSGRQLAATKDVPLKDKPQQLQTNVDRLKQAERKLKALEGEYEKLAEIERDLLELNQLAENAKKIADEAQALEDRLKNAPDGETPAQKQARENQIAREQQDLLGHQQELSNRLDDLLKRRPELLDAARKQQLDQLAELAKKALELAKPQDQLADALKKEAAKAANDVGELAKKQEELLKDAEDLQAKAAAQNRQAAVQPLDADALRKAIDELKAGNLKDALKKQQNAAKDLDRLGKELAKNDTLPADPEQAARELLKRQETLQKKIAEQAKQAPPAAADEDKKEAFRQKTRELAAEQAGIQAGVAKLNAPARVRAEQQAALNKAAETVQKLIGQKANEATDQARQTADAIKHLAKTIGSKQERTARALKKLNALRRQQQALARQVEQKTAKQKPGAKPSPKVADELRKLSKRQEDVAKQLAELDAPEAAAQKQAAVEKSAAALTDLEKGRTQDAGASQKQAEQAIANLQKQLQGKPTAADAVKQLAKQQEAVKNDTSETLNKAGAKQLSKAEKQPLRKQAAEQQKIAKQLAKLDAPAAQSEKQAARQAAEKAAEQLKKGDNRQQVADAVKQAGEALKQLQQAVDPDAQKSPAEQAEQLAKRQRNAAGAAQQQAKAKQSPKPGERQEAKEELRKIAADAKRLRVGDKAQAEKKDALERLQKAAQKQEELDRLAAKQEQKNKGKTPEKPDDQLQRLVKQNAKAQKEAADALKKLENKLKGNDAREQLAKEEQQNRQRAEQLQQPKRENPDELAKRAEQLAREQSELRKRTEQAAGEQNARKQAQAMKQLARDQQQLAQKAQQQLPADQAPLPRGDALQKLQAAKNSLQQQQLQQAAQQQKQAEQALKNLARQAQAMARNQPPAQQPGQKQPGQKQPGQQQAAKQPQGQQQAQNAQRLAKAAQQLAQRQQALARQVAQMQQQQQRAAQQNAQAANQQPGQKQPGQQQPGQKQPGQKQPGQQQAAQQQPGQQQPGQQQPNARQAVAQQQQIAQDAAKLALQTARQNGPMSPAAQQAKQFAQQATAAGKQAMTGQLQKAGNTAQQAAKSAQQSAQQLKQANPGQPNAQTPLQKQAQQLAQRQAQTAQQLQKMSQSAQAQRNARQAGQQQLAQQTQQLARQFNQAARKLAQQPLNLGQQGQQAQQSGQDAQQAQQAMQKSGQQSSQGNQGQAAQQARQAAQSLRQAANQARQAATQNPPPKSPIPGQIGKQVADAAQSLRQAQQQLANAAKPGQQPGSQQAQAGKPGQQGMGQQGMGQQGMGQQQAQNGMPGQQGMGQQGMGQQGMGQQGMGQQGMGQPGQQGRQQAGKGQPGQQGQPGQGQGQQPGSAAQSLRQAAQQLAQAARQLQQGQGQQGQQGRGQQGQQQAQNGQPGQPGENGDGQGANAPLDLSQLEAELKKLSNQSQTWGGLRGKLNTRILDGPKNDPNSHYHRLIKYYRQNINKKERTRTAGRNNR